MTTRYPPGTLGWWMNERRGELSLTWDAVAREAGIAPQTLHRAAKGTTMLTTTKKGIERALAWESGSVERILTDGEPTVAEREPEPAGATVTSLRAPEVAYAAMLLATLQDEGYRSYRMRRAELRRELGDDALSSIDAEFQALAREERDEADEQPYSG